MQRIDRYFVGAGIVMAVFGMLMGIHMGMAHDFALAPVHAHINLVGWVSLLLFGLAYRAGFALNDRWAALHFWIALAGAVVFPIGIYIAVTRENPAVAIIGSLLTLASMLLFLFNYLRVRRA